MQKLTSFFPVLLVILVLFLVLKPAISLPLPGDAYVDLQVIVTDFGKNLSFFYPPLKYYVYQYGTQFTSILIVYKLFGFNPQAYFILNIFLRIAAAVTIYLFTAKWSKSKLAAVVAGIFFGVNLPGLQPTTRVAFFFVYVGVISLFIFLDRWLKFHYQPTGKNLKLSALFFALAILSYPIRMVGIVPLILMGEIYWLVKNYNDRATLKLQIKHILALTGIILLLVFVTGTLSSTPELSFKRISTNILFISLLTGYPPVITTLWLFISNLILSPVSSIISNSGAAILKPLTLILLFLNTFFFLNCIFRKKFLLAFASLTAITFVPFVMASSQNLEGWDNNLIMITQIGGSIFLLSNLFLIYMKNRNEHLAEIGMLGSAIVLTFILFPWLISPQKSSNDQSAFNFIHRYYTIPSAGMAILLASVTAISWDSLKNNLRILKKLKTTLELFQLTKGLLVLPILLCLPILILFFTYWHMISTSNLLIAKGKGADAVKIELFWNKIEPFLKKIKEPPNTNYIYIENNSDIDEKYIKEMIADRTTITLRMVNNPPVINLIFSKQAFMEKLNKQSLLLRNKKGSNDNIYAFQFDGKEVSDIKEKIFNIK